eukprot:snap_masked-scaffold_19-processed-gene-5.11-mRNA-1 protein AED:1.00 eAED:1.00 QI:0/0/0/0/1/1/2/0/227
MHIQNLDALPPPDKGYQSPEEAVYNPYGKKYVSFPNADIKVNEKSLYKRILSPEDLYETEDQNIKEDKWMAENVTEFYFELSHYTKIIIVENMKFEEYCVRGKLVNNGYPRDTFYRFKDSEGRFEGFLPVNAYVKKVCEWIEKELEDEELFPVDGIKGFLPDFSNYEFIVDVNDINLAETLDSLFKKFMYFSWKWNLIQKREMICIWHKIKPFEEEYKLEEARFKAY